MATSSDAPQASFLTEVALERRPHFGACFQKCQSGHETVRLGASACESDRTNWSASAYDKPRRETGSCGTVLDRVGKRVRRFERPTFTLAT